ncbi:putative receptor-like protein kinase [Panicum miliaceum]|uniref:Receptor-like protein kinase n=1 Tax=Panicum miliaceum TaxID=4540 RepID=A0A3L6QWR9_PANMI|nr:putative receptor-like protein kinase [Panicum miliaceum]
MATAWDDEDFFSNHGPEIRFPFRLESSNTSSLCGAPGLELTCSGQDTIMVYPQTKSYSFKVTTID